VFVSIDYVTFDVVVSFAVPSGSECYSVDINILFINLLTGKGRTRDVIMNGANQNWSKMQGMPTYWPNPLVFSSPSSNPALSRGGNGMHRERHVKTYSHSNVNHQRAKH